MPGTDIASRGMVFACHVSSGTNIAYAYGAAEATTQARIQLRFLRIGTRYAALSAYALAMLYSYALAFLSAYALPMLSAYALATQFLVLHVLAQQSSVASYTLAMQSPVQTLRSVLHFPIRAVRY
eukprot:1416644-Rhodomonas_salina.1